MWLEAIVTREDLRNIAEQFAPLRMVLGVTGSLLLHSPREVTLVPERGIALMCDATIHWPVLGLDLPVSLRGLLLNVLPSVEARPGAAALVFRLQVDHTGVAGLPSFFDPTVTARINEELERKHVELAWKFTDTLSHAFGLPGAITSAAALAVRASAGRVKVTEEAMGLAVDVQASVVARKGASNGVLREAPAELAEGAARGLPVDDARRRRGVDARSLAMGAVAGGLLFTLMRALGGSGRRRARAWI